MWSSNLISLLLFYFSACATSIGETTIEWDTIVFVQHWLPTNCREFKAEDSSNVCVYPDKPDAWTVHGLWATRLHNQSASRPSTYPTYCNKTWELQPSDIASIQQDLDDTWPDIFNETLNFWSYEWVRHGTCLAELPSFRTPLEYFQQGLNWQKKYDLSSILEKAGIVPSNNITYKSDDMSNAVERNLGKKPKLRCSWHDTKQHISQLRICFTKAEELTDCELTSSDLKRSQRAIKDKAYHTVLKPTGKCDPTVDLFYALH